jgi:hypothetical protein
MSAIIAGAAVWFYIQYWVGLWGAASPEEQTKTYWVEVRVLSLNKYFLLCGSNINKPENPSIRIGSLMSRAFFGRTS